MYIKSKKEAISQQDLQTFREKLKVGSRIKIKIRNPFNLEKKIIVNAEVTHLYPHFAIVTAKYRGRPIQRSILYIDYYKAKLDKTPVPA